MLLTVLRGPHKEAARWVKRQRTLFENVGNAVLLWFPQERKEKAGYID